MLPIHAVIVCATVAGWPCHAHAIHVEVEPGAHVRDRFDARRRSGGYADHAPAQGHSVQRLVQPAPHRSPNRQLHDASAFRRGVVAGAESSSGSGPAELDAGYAPSRGRRDRRAVHREHGHRCLEPVGFPPRAGGKNATIPPRVRDARLRRRFRVGRGGWRDANRSRSNADHHRAIALTSIGLSTAGTVMMWFWKD